ncbi:MAG: hypothetical protein ABSE82_16075 [Nitrososphaerales archaeon]|jgi:hypothetical protein
MKNDIAEKLNREFAQDIVSERQVVYILVEARKLLEQQVTLKTFPAFSLCSDWAVHPKLNRANAQFVLRHFDAYETEYRKSGVTVAESKLQPLLDFMSHKKFREEFIGAIGPHGVRVDRLASDEFWRAFIQNYSAVVQDCPLEAQANTTQFVNNVTCLAWPKEQADALYPGRHVVQWNWNLKSGAPKEKLVCTLI